ncbi:rod shape-determining protein RodA [Pelagibaculum spongiae]|uniref:Peptidoglycan glycosyltransferase MrdB n=1 Tax=Pelagibaculum spongiae TaxID=2080658 RepID=A0A2V1H5Q8_9GAMM|nr:rod shape-determining protein RodA [Pelagibaculum spongiae]PVZ72095.1 rod shape-determining protein RodA [Pelagibaculum spongiae]
MIKDFQRKLDGQASMTSTPLSHRLHIDLPLFGLLLALLSLGLLVLYSASNQSLAMIRSQGIRIVAGLLVMIVVAQLNPRIIRQWAPVVYAISLSMLVAVLLVGVEGKGAQRWLDVGVARVQPSELMKLAMPCMIAWWMHKRRLPPDLKSVAFSLVLLALPAVLILKQPDLGTTILVFAAGFFVLLFAGLRIRWLIYSAIVAIPAVVAFWFFVMRDYQKQRVYTFLDPERDPLGAGYHIIQSKIAIGSGGVFGKGWTQGTQSQLEFLPERHTDFIFSVFSEELGLAGIVILLTLYFLIIARGLFIAMQGPDSFSRLLGGSIVCTFFVYVFVNIGMVSGLLPVVGVPLPLVSYGGTSMVTLLLSFGMLMSIGTHPRRISG